MLVGLAWQPARAPARARPPMAVRDDADASICGGRVDRAAFRFGTAEPADLPACVSVLMEAFYKDILTLAKDEFSEAELEK